MAKAGSLRFRGISAGFAVYSIAVTLAAYLLSPQIGPYVDPGATFWLSAAYMVLGAVALAGICSGALVRAAKIEDRIDALEALQRRVLEIEEPRVDAIAVTDSGSPELEVEELMERLDGIVEIHELDVGTQRGAAEEILLADAGEIRRLRKVRQAVGLAALGPAVAAVGLVAAFAPLLPASDGLLYGNLQLAAFFGVAGLATLIGLAAYAAAAFHRVRVTNA